MARPSHGNKMAFIHFLFVLAALVSSTFAADPLVDLQECGAGIEIQFFNAYIDIVNLPPTCKSKDLTDIGFLIQDVVEEVDGLMPTCLGEKMSTTSCPFPETIGWEETRRYQATGRGERRTNNPASRRLATNACSITEKIAALQGKAAYAASTSKVLLKRMMKRASDDAFENVELAELLQRASDGARACQEASESANEAEKAATKLCASENALGSSTERLIHQAETEYETAKAAASRAKDALSQTRKAKHEMNVLYYMKHACQDHVIPEGGRVLEKSTCSYADDAERDYQRAVAAVEEAKKTMRTIDDLAGELGTTEAAQLQGNAEGELETCEAQLNSDTSHEKDKAHDACDKAKWKGRANMQVSKARMASSKVKSAADRADQALSKMKDCESQLQQDVSALSSKNAASVASSTDPPTAQPTQSPTKPPTSSPIEPSSEFVNMQTRPSENDYVSRLLLNLESSNTSCEDVVYAIQQKTLAEEALLVGDVVFDSITQLATTAGDNAEVGGLRVDAYLAHLRVQDESAKSAAAAQRSSDLCSEGNQELLMKDELEVATAAANQTRLALAELKMTRDKVEEVIAILGFDPTLSNLRPGTDNAATILLLKHMGLLESEMAIVDSRIQELADTDPAFATALERKRASLLEEEMDVETALTSKEPFHIGHSALKKDEYYQSVAPDSAESPPMEYTSDSSPTGTSHDKAATAMSREEWFQRFTDMVADRVKTRLLLGFDKKVGGCIRANSKAIYVAVVVNEIESVWEQFDPVQCTTAFLARGGRGRSGK
jgi:hypothetical protein